MRLNWAPTKPAFIDFETQSSCDLKKHTTHQYAKHPSTQILTCVVDDGTQVHRFGPYLDANARQRLAAIASTHTLVAHNASFDKAIWDAAGLPDAEWFDTLRPARAAGLPGQLDKLSKVLGFDGKDSNGKRLIELLCIVKNGKVPAIGPAHKMLLDYNERDVRELRNIYSAVLPFVEPAVMSVDWEINERGLPANRELATAIREMYTKNEETARSEFEKLAPDVSPGSPKQVVEWLNKQGFKVDGINKFVWKSLIANPHDFFVGDSDFDASFELIRDALDFRRDIVRVGSGKVDAMLQVIEADGRIRDQFVYWGAHTGRWSGRKIQPHNMPQSIQHLHTLDIVPTMDAVKAACEHAMAEFKRLGQPRVIVPADALGSMLRHVIQCDNMLVADYGAVEARCVAWLARCERMLAIFRDPGKSIYCDMGKSIFGREISKKHDYAEYNFSKALVLGCTYGMSGAKFEWMCKTRNVDTSALERLGIDIKDAVKKFRETYPELPALWRTYQEAMLTCIGGTSLEAGRVFFCMNGRDMHVVLPSGRPLVYRNARTEMMVPGYAKMYNMPAVPVPTVVYDNPRGHMSFMYGSKMCENISQAVCRDPLAETLVSSEQLGLRPILHVHDECGNEAPDARLEEMCEMMSAPRKWAPDFPLLVEGYSGPVWTKQTKKYREISAMNGKVIHGH